MTTNTRFLNATEESENLLGVSAMRRPASPSRARIFFAGAGLLTAMGFATIGIAPWFVSAASITAALGAFFYGVVLADW